MSMHELKLVAEFGDCPGIRLCVKRRNWGDLVAVSRKMLKRRILKRKIYLILLVLGVLAEEALYYGFGGGPYWVVAATIAFAMLVTLVLVPASSIDVGVFVKQVRDLHWALDTSFERLAHASSDELRTMVWHGLVSHAIEVRKIELENARVPREHWLSKKELEVHALENLYNSAKAFKLIDGGYKPIYQEADKQLQAA